MKIISLIFYKNRYNKFKIINIYYSEFIFDKVKVKCLDDFFSYRINKIRIFFLKEIEFIPMHVKNPSDPFFMFTL